MPVEKIIAAIERSRIIAILRGDMRGREIEIAETLVLGGIRAIEVSVVTPDFSSVIGRLHQHFGKDAAIGAGTVLTLEELSTVADAGASFIVSPNVDLEIIQHTRQLGLASIPGAYTATETVLAIRGGADAVKIFPAVSVGPGYIKALLAPLPNARLVPTGGITLQNMEEYLAAGAFALGIGSELVGKQELESHSPEPLLAKARAYADHAKKRPDAQ